MKISMYALVTIALISCTLPAAKADSRVYPLKPKYAFAPKGFDSNDNAQLVLAGGFSDYCMKVGSTQYKVDRARKKIYINATYSTTNNCNDIEMYFPYSIEMSLGTLPEGNYEVFVLDTDRQYTAMTTLPISKAKDSVNGQTDERLYAPVSSIEFKPSLSGDPQLVIKGVFPNTCITLSNIEVHQRMGDVFEVLPIAEARKFNCAAVMTPFTKTVTLKGFTVRDTLIHVRSMSGQSINKVITAVDRLK